MKKIIKNITYFVEINAILFICHFWAFCGVAFNDTGVKYSNIYEAIGTILWGIVPLVIGTIILVNIFKKNKEFLIYQFLVLQALVIVGWGMFYIVNYVPNSILNLYLEEKQYDREISKQERINNEAEKELIQGYKVIDMIEKDSKKITLYLNEKSNKLIVEFKIDETINYDIVEITKKNVEAKVKFSKYDEDYIIEFDEYDNLSIILNSNRYYIYSNCVIKNNTYNYARGMSITIKGNEVNPINEYRKMIEDSILKGEKKYCINDNKFFEIEKTDVGVNISQETIKYKEENRNYTWVIIKDGKTILQKGLKENELIFEEDLTKKKFYEESGDYEIYIKTFDNNIGYFKVSNSVYWSNK